MMPEQQRLPFNTMRKRNKETAISYPSAELYDCPCGAHAGLRGRYATEGGRLTWYYAVFCYRCNARIKLFGDVFQKSDAVTAWNRFAGGAKPCA